MKHMWSEEEIQALVEEQGGGSEVHLYQHIVKLQFTIRSFGPTTYSSFTIVTNNSESINETYIRNELGINSKNNSLYVNSLDKDKYFTQCVYVDRDGKITINGINLQDWSEVENLKSYSQSITDIITQLL